MKKLITGFKTVFIIILALILFVNVYIMIQAKSSSDSVPDVFGYKPFVVLSGSMESEINIGDLIFVKNVNINDLRENDIIAFRDNENLVTTHRIIEILELNNKKCFRTKGDNNNLEDEGTVCEKQIEGKYQWKIAKVGNFIMFIQKPLGFAIMMLSILIVCILVYFTSSRTIDKMDDEELREFEEFKKAKAKARAQERK